MPWCPNCKTEYREGITHCADCKAELVADLNEREEKLKNATAMIVKVDGNQTAFAGRLVDFLEYSNVPARLVREKDGMLAVYTDPQDFNTAKRLFKAFYSVESERLQKEEEEAFLAGKEIEEAFFSGDSGENAVTDSETVPDLDEMNPEEQEQISGSRYGSAVSRYEDYRSSGSVFTVLGGLGVLFSASNLCGILSIFNVFSATVLLVFFCIFFALGVFSYAKAGKLKGAADHEKELIAAANQWLSEHITKESLHAFDELSVRNIAIEDDATLARTEDILYLNRIDAMRETLGNLFPDLNPSLAEQLAEEYYATHFEEDD